MISPRAARADPKSVPVKSCTQRSSPPLLAGLDGLLRSVLSSRCAPIGILGVIAVPRQFHVRLSEALLHRAAWLGHARPEKTFEGLYEHMARLASTMLLEDRSRWPWF